MKLESSPSLDLGEGPPTPCPSTLSDFRLRVYAACQQIPAGRVTTYAALATAVGCKSSRAIGNALRHNPYAPRVPCHRVIRTDLSIGGFSGSKDPKGTLVKRKRALLAEEGVFFKTNAKGRLVLAHSHSLLVSL
eukprot:CAMPEP_0177653238 /NCGR_PEP_ID=MMETSP0447-20121125/13619_1 /TAXON_ID=0 /ORGANISM="Stygamoeba regulata, Strain BSH-02190019" /LENGTH=133 /DNA_ID=CAMNT_0019156661 /DNA_START=10 /DNA_END=411 /DNA_ORIENTATION=-